MLPGNEKQGKAVGSMPNFSGQEKKTDLRTGKAGWLASRYIGSSKNLKSDFSHGSQSIFFVFIA